MSRVYVRLAVKAGRRLPLHYSCHTCTLWQHSCVPKTFHLPGAGRSRREVFLGPGGVGLKLRPGTFSPEKALGEGARAP